MTRHVDVRNSEDVTDAELRPLLYALLRALSMKPYRVTQPDGATDFHMDYYQSYNDPPGERRSSTP